MDSCKPNSHVADVNNMGDKGSSMQLSKCSLDLYWKISRQTSHNIFLIYEQSSWTLFVNSVWEYLYWKISRQTSHNIFLIYQLSLWTLSVNSVWEQYSSLIWKLLSKNCLEVLSQWLISKLACDRSWFYVNVQRFWCLLKQPKGKRDKLKQQGSLA